MGFQRHDGRARRAVLLLLLAAAAVFGLFCAAGAWRERQIDTDELLFDALADAAAWQSYRYTLASSLLLNNYRTAETALRGDVRDDDLRVIGKLLNTEIDVFKSGGSLCRYDGAVGGYARLDDCPEITAPLLRTVLYPAVNLGFEDVVSVRFLGRIRVGGRKYYRYDVVPKDGFHILGAGFGDFEYKIDVNPKNRRVAAASFAAKAETPRQNRLTLKVRFFDVNGDFSVELPENAVPVRGTD
ncbi:MAG: hypothetical protein ACOX8R_03280 [Bacillota bacterium]|jgi:hypothetical protein